MKAGLQWPIGIVAVLTATVIGNVAMMRVANNDPSFAIEPDYYKKAVAFDSTMANEQRSRALGWTATSTVDPVVAGQPTAVHVQLLDATQQPITDATVRVVALYNARANDLLTVPLTHERNGTYSAALDINFPGQWEVRVEATRAGVRFASTARVDVAAGAAR